MISQRGFLPLFLLILTAVSVSAVISGYTILNRKNQNKVKTENPVVTVTPVPSTAPYFEVVTILPSTIVPSPTPKFASFLFSINDNGAEIKDESLEFVLKNERSGEEKKYKNNVSSWSLSNLEPSTYKLYVIYPNNKYFNIERKCDGCQGKTDISTYGICGYHINLFPADNIVISCSLRSTRPLIQNGSTAGQTSNDTTPPTTNIYYPQQNDSITYKIDGKVCAIATQPTDNSGPVDIETEYKFDDAAWSGFAKNRAYLCTGSLSNGAHTLFYHSRDKAGNVEATKTISFSVNIK